MESLFFDFSGTNESIASQGRIRAFLSLAAAGDMKFEKGKRNQNREAFLSAIGLEGRHYVGVELAHSKKAVFVGSGGPGPGSKADGLFTEDRRLCLGVTVADCMPIWFLDRSSGAFGVLHSGWKGTGICLEALTSLKAMGTKPEDFAFILGPCIGSCCYEVPPERAVQFMDSFGADAAICREGRWFLDMQGANRKILGEAGVNEVVSVELCTACDLRMGSLRRQGQGKFVRMLAGIGAFFPLDRRIKNR